MDNHSSTGSSLFFVDSVPDLSQLCQVVFEVLDWSGLPAVHHKQPHIIRCRELIFIEPEILATPMLGDQFKFTVILQQSLYRSGKLQNRAAHTGLAMEKPKKVTVPSFKDCLNYTILAKLAPAWNRMGTYLVQGRDFLQSKTKMPAVEMELNFTGDELYLNLKAETISSQQIKIEDLNICKSVVCEFKTNQEYKIEEYSIESKWCHILPSMKKGQVINVCHKVPKDSPFTSYKELKRHWKNMYGYRLPETNDGMIYYQIYFKPVGETLFTYPECCVRSREVKVFPRTEALPITQAFLKDFHDRISKICGLPLEFHQKPKYIDSKLLEASTVEDEVDGFVTQEIPTPLYGYRKQPQVFKMSENAIATQENTENIIPNSQMYSTQSDKKIVPIFKGAFKRKHTEEKPNKKSQSPKSATVPNFKQRPMIQTERELNPKIANIAPHIGDIHNIGRSQTDMYSLSSYSNTWGRNIHRANGVASQHNKFNQNMDDGDFRPAKYQRPNDESVWSGSQNCGQYKTQVSSAHDYYANSRQQLQEDTSALLNVPRTHNKIQTIRTDIDIPALARANQLEKVNVATLSNWLKQKGIPVRAKEKKNDLIDKIMMAVI